MMGSWIRFLPRKNKQQVDQSLRCLIAHAYQNVPFYRRIYQRAGIDPASVRGVKDLPRLPIVSRLDLMAGGPTEYLSCASSPDRLTVRHTTGTTGTPVMIHMNKMEEAFRRITVMDALRRNAALTFPMILVDVGPEKKDSATKIFMGMGPVTIVRLFRGMPMDEQIGILTNIRPTIIGGRPSSLWELARALRERNITPPMPRLITSGAELLFPHVRTLLEHIFCCRVADYYNCEEAGNLAWQCPDHADRMHQNTSTAWMEAIDENGHPVSAGNEGRIIITNLFNYSMPFIRYEMGDRGVLIDEGLCECGFNGPAMRLTEGRNENFIILPDGREISPRIMYDVVNSVFPHDQPGWSMIEAVRVFQIIQEETDLISIRVVPGPAYSESLWRPVEENIRKLHPALRLKVETVDDLRPETGKKFHQVLGKLSSRWTRELESR